MIAGTTLQLVTTLADNLLANDNAHDPGPDAAALAVASEPADVVSASGEFCTLQRQRLLAS